MRAALRHLCEKGVEALKPQRHTSKPVVVGNYIAKPSQEVWRRPVVSKRVANIIRKEAIAERLIDEVEANLEKSTKETSEVVAGILVCLVFGAASSFDAFAGAGHSHARQAFARC